MVAQRSATPLLEHLIARDVLDALVRDVSGTDARLVPLKGVLLVALGVRPPTERGTIDVDVLVSPEDAPRVLDAARGRGWVASLGNGAACSLAHPDLPMPVDLHRALFPPLMFALDTAGVLARARSDSGLFGLEVQRMHELDVYAHLVGHFVKGRSDHRDQRHLTDFAALGRWMTCSPTECADHLARHGLSRAARYTLGLALAGASDPFARSVLKALPRDRRGDLLVRASTRLLGAIDPGSWLGIPAAHALNADLRSGARSLVAHLTEPRGDDRSRDGWWLP